MVTERVTPTCPDCDRRMASGGAGQVYRCRDCGPAAGGEVVQPVVRDFDAPMHPER